MNKITLKYEDGKYFLELVNNLNDSMITRIILTKPEMLNLQATLNYYIG